MLLRIQRRAIACKAIFYSDEKGKKKEEGREIHKTCVSSEILSWQKYNFDP
jgi:hypothetical protein